VLSSGHILMSVVGLYYGAIAAIKNMILRFPSDVYFRCTI